jgi:hypothetical protein
MITMPFGEEKSLEINQEDSVFGSGSALIETFASDKIEITAKTGIYTAEFLDSRLRGDFAMAVSSRGRKRTRRDRDA